MKLQITKLHLLIFLIVGGLAFFGHYALHNRKAEAKRRDDALSRELALQADAELEKEREKKLAETVQPAPEESKPAPEPGNPAAVTYIVKKNDTLWGIAKRPEHFGQGHRWYDIWKANEDKIGDFDQVETGTSLLIPLDKPDGYDWPETSEEKKQAILSHPEPRRKLPPAVN